MTKHFQLPEKEHFSLEEIAKRWECGIDQVYHYINDMRILRVAVLSRHAVAPSITLYGQIASSWPGTDLTQDDFIELPKFLYVCPWEFNGYDNAETATCQEDYETYEAFDHFEDFEGKEYLLVDEGAPHLAERNISSPLIDVSVIGADFIITREERDRVEREYSAAQESKQPNEHGNMQQENVSNVSQEIGKLRKEISGQHSALNANNNARYTMLERQSDLLQHENSVLSDKLAMLTERNAELEAAANAKNKASLSNRGEITYLNIIGAMLELFLSESPSGVSYSQFKTQAAIIDILDVHHKGKQGISKRCLEEQFAAANRQLKKADDL